MKSLFPVKTGNRPYRNLKQTAEIVSILKSGDPSQLKTIRELPSSLLGSKSFAPSLFGSLMMCLGNGISSFRNKRDSGVERSVSHRQRHCWTLHKTRTMGQDTFLAFDTDFKKAYDMAPT